MKFLPSRQPTREVSPRPSGYPDKAKQMLALLGDPQGAGTDFRKQFIEAYDAAGRRAYPLSWAIKTEIDELSGITGDYTLQCFDRRMLQLMDDEAHIDTTMKTFVDDMLQKLQGKSSRPRHAIYPEVLEIIRKRLFTAF